MTPEPQPQDEGTDSPILVALEAISAQRQGSFAIMVVSEAANLYAQFLAHEEQGLDSEIASNAFLAEGYQLGAAQEVAMQERGWTLGYAHDEKTPDDNWVRHWPDDTTPEARALIAQHVLSTLRDVHGPAHDGAFRPGIVVHLEGDYDAALSEKLRSHGITVGNERKAPAGSPWPVLLIALLLVLLLIWLQS
jgi:hypothetical protein